MENAQGTPPPDVGWPNREYVDSVKHGSGVSRIEGGLHECWIVFVEYSYLIGNILHVRIFWGYWFLYIT